MSKFWQTAQSSDSEDEVEVISDTEIKNRKQMGGRFNTFDAKSDSESDDDGGRVVKSQKDRQWDNLKDSVKKIKNAMKTTDWSLIQDEFEELNKKIEKSKILILQHGIPKFYIKIISEVADAVQEIIKDKEAFKKLKPIVQKSVNQMKLKVRKHNEKYKTEIEDYKSNPTNYASTEEEESEESEDEDSDSDDSSEEESSEESSEDGDVESDDNEESGSSVEDSDDDDDVKVKKPKSKFLQSDSEDSEYVDDDDEDSDEDNDIQAPGGEFKLTGRLKWMKTEALIRLMPHLEPYLKKKKGNERLRIQGPGKKQKFQEKRLEQDKEGRRTAATSSAWIIDKNVTEEMLEKKLKEIVGSRGRKGTNVKDSIRALEVLAKAARLHGPRREIPVIMHLISALFDSNKTIDEHMDVIDWRTAYRYLTRIISLLERNKTLVLGMMAEEDITDLMVANSNKKASEEGKDDFVKPVVDDNTGSIKVVGSLETFLTRLDEEYTKSLQQINPHTQEYVSRLADEASLMELSESIRFYYIRLNNYSVAANIALLHVEHIYYKHDTIALAVQRAHYFNKQWGNYKDLHPASLGDFTNIKLKKFDSKIIHPGAYIGNPTVVPPPYNAEVKLEELSNFIFKYGEDRSKARALLCNVYHKAVHDQFYSARDMFLISHIQETIDKMDIKTQILYNRVLVMLGISAFRLGLISKAHDCLVNICSNKMKELLAQGTSKFSYDRDPDQEKIERRRQLPYHMHINPDLIESCHLISAMLLELPVIAKANGVVTLPVNPISRVFRKYFLSYTKQIFTGPPENTREIILSAAKALLNGQWEKSLELLLGLESWSLLPGNGAERVKALLHDRIKEEGVRIYLLIYGSHFESISLSHICEMFKMDEVLVRRIISTMIFNKEISGAWEHPANILILYKIDPSNTQTISQTIVEKVNSLLESNERLIDPFSGMYGYKDDRDNYQNRDNRNDRTNQNRNKYNRSSNYTGRGSNNPRVFTNKLGSSRSRNVNGQLKSGPNVWSSGKKHTFNERGNRSNAPNQS
eukprot:gene20205-26227_t